MATSKSPDCASCPQRKADHVLKANACLCCACHIQLSLARLKHGWCPQNTLPSSKCGNKERDPGSRSACLRTHRGCEEMVRGDLKCIKDTLELPTQNSSSNTGLGREERHAPQVKQQAGGQAGISACCDSTPMPGPCQDLGETKLCVRHPLSRGTTSLLCSTFQELVLNGAATNVDCPSILESCAGTTPTHVSDWHGHAMARNLSSSCPS